MKLLIFQSITLVKLTFAGHSPNYIYDQFWDYQNQPWDIEYCNNLNSYQSPININTNTAISPGNSDEYDIGKFATSLKNQEFLAILNDPSLGHQLKFDFPAESEPFIQISQNSSLACSQFHFHFSTSEHSIDNNFSFGEMHLVCYNSEKYSTLDTAIHNPENDKEAVNVLGFLVDICQEKSNVNASRRNKNGEILSENGLKFDENSQDDSCHNSHFQKIIDLKENFESSVAKNSLILPLPENLSTYYRYLGSLTTPGCEEVVVWSMFSESVKISAEQADIIKSWESHLIKNNRDVQELKDRQILVYNYSSSYRIVPALSVILLYFGL